MVQRQVVKGEGLLDSALNPVAQPRVLSGSAATLSEGIESGVEITPDLFLASHRIFRNIQEVRAVVEVFVENDNEHWPIKKMGFCSPNQARRDFDVDRRAASCKLVSKERGAVHGDQPRSRRPPAGQSQGRHPGAGETFGWFCCQAL